MEREKDRPYKVTWRQAPIVEGASLDEAFAPFFFDGFSGEIRAGQTLIHFGCGKGKTAHGFISKGLNVTLVEISPYSLDEEIRNMLPLHSHQLHFVQACLWKLPKELKSAYWLYCCDTLEHLPEESIDRVLEQMGERMRYGGYVSIALKEDPEKKPITLKKRDWWVRKLQKHFTIKSEDAFSDDRFLNCCITRV